MLAVLHEEMLRRLAKCVVLALHGVVARVKVGLSLAAMWELPGLLPLGDVILAVLDVAPTLDEERAETVLGELLRRPAAGDPGADDDGVERLVALWRHQTAHARPTRVSGTHPSKRPGTCVYVSSLVAPISDV